MLAPHHHCSCLTAQVLNTHTDTHAVHVCIWHIHAYASGRSHSQVSNFLQLPLPSNSLPVLTHIPPTYFFLLFLFRICIHTHTHAHAHAIEGRSERGRGYLRNGNGMGGDGLVCWDPWIRSICTICILQASCPRMIIFFLSLRSPVAFSFFFYTSTYKLYVIIHVYTVVLVLLDLSTHMWICLIITISPHGPLFLSSNRQRNRRG